MQSLESSRQEADFMVNEALNKLRRTTGDSSSLLIDHNDYTSVESTSFITNPSRSPPVTLVAPLKHSTVSNQSGCEKRPASDSHNLSSIQSYTSGSNPSKRSKLSASTSFSTASTSKSSSTSSTENNKDAPFFDIHDKLRELYGLLYCNDEQNRRTETRVKLRSRSQALQLLVARENLNTVILNLYPGNKGYSLAFRQGSNGKSLEQHGDNSHGLGTSRNTTKLQSGAADDSTENLLETTRWPYEVDSLLECIDNETLPMLFIDLLESREPSVFYSGCVIVEVRDFRQTFQMSACCDTYFVLLKPTNQTLLADVNFIASESDFSSEEKLALESQLVLATSGPLCLDPDPQIGRNAINSQHRRQMWNTSAIRRQMKKFSQVAINRKRKIDQFTHIHGLELHDHMTRTRQKQRVQAENADDPSKLPKRPIDIVKPIRAPNLEFPPLAVPSKVNLNAKAYERPKKKTDFRPLLVEEHILSTEREDRVCHTKISIYQRPINSEFVGELYVDRDYKEGENNGDACQFSLGTRMDADRYVKQFTDIFSEEGRKNVTLTYNVPGKVPIVTVLGQKRILNQQQHQQLQLPQTIPQQLLQQHQLQYQSQPLLASPSIPTAPSSSISSVNATNINTLPGNKIMPNNSANIIGISNVNQSQQQFLQSQPNQTHMQQIYNTCDINNSTIQMATQIQQHSQQPTHLNLANGSFVVVQQPSGNLTVANPQQSSQANTTIRNSSLAQSVPVLQSHLQSTNQQQSQQHDQTPSQQQLMQQKNPITTLHSTNPEITALVTSFMNSESQFQQQAAANSNAQKSSNNAAIISLLNSAPAAMTSSPVVNSTLTASNAVPTSVPSENLVNQKQSQTAMHHAITQSILAGNVRKMMPQKQQNRIHSTNLVSVGTNVINSPQINIGIQQQHQQMQQSSDQQNVRVTMSALASQLASPPALMSSANINTQNFNFAQSSIISNNNNNNNNNTVKQQVILSSSNARLLNQAQAIRRDSMTAPSPGSDSNTSNTSGTNVSYQMSNLNALLATSPNSTNVDGSAHSNQNASALLDRLTHQTIASQSPGPTAPQFMSPSPKTPTIQQQQIQVQSPTSMSPLSSPPPQQTTTINVQGFNLSSLQGAMSAFPGILENVQVQIPGQPFSLSLSGAAGTNTQPTSLLISVPVTSSTQSSSGQSVPSSSIGSSTQTVVLTNANAQSGTTGSMLSLPLAQLVGVKGLGQQTLRGASPMNTAGGSIQLLSTIQRPRTVPINAATFNAKHLAARGLGHSPRNFQISSMKLGSPLSVAPASHITTTANITANPLLMTSQQLHLKLHKPAQSQPYINMSPSQTTTSVVAPTGDISLTSPIQAKHRPSSTTDVNK
ncbi:Transcription factor SPT20 like [Pseudolycoriella hygida]|uniref:Transcription factor SPT20 like n=1 Tax=Pseudolycoriella hygida TaxID=35572 RepID=A0A9Q0S842_9DIPT|nr:Transcription factor SPT20 like [Pseudolycoriella hygida]